MAGDGGAAQEEVGGDGRVAESLGDELGDLELPRGELAVAALATLGAYAAVCGAVIAIVMSRRDVTG
jgi:hypothetical protein